MGGTAEQRLRLLSLQYDSPEKYAGIVLTGLVVAVALYRGRRFNARLFLFFLGMLLFSVVVGTGRASVLESNWTTGRALLDVEGVPRIARMAALLALVGSVAFLIEFVRRNLATWRGRMVASAVLFFLLLVPVFHLLAFIPLFGKIRAPFVFYDMGAPFFGAMVAGFFVTDMMARGRSTGELRGDWAARTPAVVMILVALMVLDYWPYQKPMKEGRVSSKKLENLRSTYEALGKDPSWFKSFAWYGHSFFHLLGPMYGDKPQVHEWWAKWNSPIGTGRLLDAGMKSLKAHQAFLNLTGARYIVFEKTYPSAGTRWGRSYLDFYLDMFPIVLENRDFVLFRNPHANQYVSGYTNPCLFVGDFRDSAPLTIALAERGFPLVNASPARVNAMTPERRGRFSMLYVADSRGLRSDAFRAEVQQRIVRLNEGSPVAAPAFEGAALPLGDLRLERKSSDVVHISLTAPADGLIVIAESYYPYWRADVDGQPHEVLRVSTGLMGLELPKGRHEITMRYEPPRAYLYAGLFSLATLIVCAGVVIRGGRR